eukprot:gene2949-2990_t
MLIARSVADLRQALAPYRRPAFVPTMGNLHDGHIALVRQAKPLGDVTVASIFVNRLQFLPHEDFDSYPRTWEADCAQLQAAGCEVLFAPRETDLYPEPQTFKEAVALSQALKRLAQQWLDASDRSTLEAQAQDALRARGWAPDYLTVRRRADLLPATADDAAGTLVALGAARLGSTRLIDNLEF